MPSFKRLINRGLGTRAGRRRGMESFVSKKKYSSFFI